MTGAALAAAILCGAPACGGDKGDTGGGSTSGETTGEPGDDTTSGPGGPTGDVDTGVTPTTTDEPTTAVDPSSSSAPSSTSGDDTTTGATDGPICAHLGGIDGVGELVAGFLDAVLKDSRINAYFLTSDLDWDGLGQCVVDQLGEATGCAGVAYGCKSMLAAHEGLGISTQDFTDFAEDFTAAWAAHAAAHPDVTQEDFDTVIGVLGGLGPDVIEDDASDLSVYQRVGRKPAIQAMIGHPGEDMSFVDYVSKDDTIAVFFGNTDFERLNTCLVRQVHSIDGPQTYGKERDEFAVLGVEPGTSASEPCRDMMTAHEGLVDDMDMGIESVDFMSLLTALVSAMTDAGITAEDQIILGDSLVPLCAVIVSVDPENCP